MPKSFVTVLCKIKVMRKKNVARVIDDNCTTMAGTVTHSQLLARARKMKLIERKPRMSAATKKKRAADKRKRRTDVRCKSDPRVLSDNFKAAVPSAHKISQLDYYGFLEVKKEMNKHVSKIRAHAKRCHPDFEHQLNPRYDD